ncbi:MAG: RNA polymerase factor sigma-54 [Hyphomicrobiales bacterium]|nr:RNA polymerase factor sigma-54 [Hyphomicrobiales bacterium]MDE2016200.1 RNA polymerase factor sigma-54 [Hyphomicrobiales bacterium]
MALSAKLMMRQGQSLVMTPQLLQAIKLLQFSTVELAAFVEDELEKNPVLSRIEESESAFGDDLTLPTAASDDGPSVADWVADSDAEARATGIDAVRDDFVEPDRIPSAQEATTQAGAPDGLSQSAWTGVATSTAGGGGEAPDLEAYVAAPTGLHEHLAAQVGLAFADPADRLIAAALIARIAPSGYFDGDVAEVATALGAPVGRVEAALARIRRLDPAGVGARDLAECLLAQLEERDRADPAMRALVANLPLLAKRDWAALRRLCGVDDEDLADMAAEIRRLEPKPGRAFGADPVVVAVADVFVTEAPDGSWRVELNSDALPRVLVDRAYAARVVRGAKREDDRRFVQQKLQDAQWLTRSLDQRARTILKVASEIVRKQDGFLAHGVERLRPMNLRDVAEEIGLHESTVSRVTSNKWVRTPRGLFEMKYFFTNAVAAADGGDGVSAEAVRHRIRRLVEAEDPARPLADEALVKMLHEGGVEVARRTVAKYRESLGIASSSARRRVAARV